MSPHDFSTGLCRGRDTLPLHPIPRNQTMAVYTEELTHLNLDTWGTQIHLPGLCLGDQPTRHTQRGPS